MSSFVQVQETHGPYRSPEKQFPAINALEQKYI